MLLSYECPEAPGSRAPDLPVHSEGQKRPLLSERGGNTAVGFPRDSERWGGGGGGAASAVMVAPALQTALSSMGLSFILF